MFMANLICFLVGAFVNLLLIRKYVFQFNRFALINDYVATITVNGGLILFGSFVLVWVVGSFEINVYLAKLLISGATFACNYLLRKLYFSSSVLN